MGVKEILLDRAKNEGLERGRHEERAKAEDEKRENVYSIGRFFDAA